MQSIRPLRWIEQAEARQVTADALAALRREPERRTKMRTAVADALSQALAWVQAPFAQDVTAVQLQPVRVRVRREPTRPMRYDDRW